jgi:hypothetical protein
MILFLIGSELVEAPKTAFPDIVKRQANVVFGSHYSASRHGGRVAFIGVPPSWEEHYLRAKAERKSAGPFPWDVFVIKNGAMWQASHLATYIGFASPISYDGSAVGIGVYAKPLHDFQYERRDQRVFDLSIVDLNAKVVAPTGLLERLAADPAFAN